MNRIAIIPARGGSKRLPGKNIKELAGKPLIQHTIDAVKDCFEKVIVSTDCTEIADTIRPYKNVEVIIRPPHLATDESKVIYTVYYHFLQNDNNNFNQIWLCLPTCPLRETSDIQNGFKLLDNEKDGILSITEYEFPPDLGLLMQNTGLLSGYLSSFPLASGNSRSQDQKNVFRPNGAFYGMWWESFRRYQNFYQGKVYGYFMPRERSVDIDSPLDFHIAEFLLQLKK